MIDKYSIDCGWCVTCKYHFAFYRVLLLNMNFQNLNDHLYPVIKADVTGCVSLLPLPQPCNTNNGKTFQVDSWRKQWSNYSWLAKRNVDSLSAYLYTLTEDEMYYSSANSTAQFMRAHLYHPSTSSILNEINLTDCQLSIVRYPNTGLYLEALTVWGNKTKDTTVMELLVFYPQNAYSLIANLDILFSEPMRSHSAQSELVGFPLRVSLHALLRKSQVLSSELRYHFTLLIHSLSNSVVLTQIGLFLPCLSSSHCWSQDIALFIRGLYAHWRINRRDTDLSRLIEVFLTVQVNRLKFMPWGKVLKFERSITLW